MPTSFRTYIFLGVLLLVATGVAFAETMFPPEHATVLVTKDGFVPAEVVIAPGGTVVWRNADTRSHWPASAAHPDHTAYPVHTEDDCLGSAFDACRGIGPDETWSYTFAQVGEWQYHDHLSPGLHGIVRVRTAPKPSDIVANIGRSFAALFNTEESQRAAALPAVDAFRALSAQEQHHLIRTTSAEEPVRAWVFLKDAAREDGEVILNAHEMAHSVGNALYRKRGIEGITACDDTFAFGCYHGVTEELFRQNGPSIVAATAARCRDLFPQGDGVRIGESGIGYSGCIHGMGHGLLTWEGLNVDQALRDCDVLGKRERPYCYDGVFMEYSFSATKDMVTIDDPWTLCRQIGPAYQSQCARYLPNLLRSVHDVHDTTTLGRICAHAPAEELHERCVDNVGFAIAQSVRSDPQLIRERCTAIGTSAARCMTAAAGELIFQGYAGWKENADALCDMLSSTDAEACHERNADIARRYNRP